MFISAETAEAVFNWPDAIAALRRAYAQHADKALPTRDVQSYPNPRRGSEHCPRCRPAEGTSVPSSWVFPGPLPIPGSSTWLSSSTARPAGSVRYWMRT